MGFGFFVVGIWFLCSSIRGPLVLGYWALGFWVFGVVCGVFAFLVLGCGCWSVSFRVAFSLFGIGLRSLSCKVLFFVLSFC